MLVIAGALQKLTMNGNLISSVAPELGQLSKLRELHLQGNELTALPEELYNLEVKSHQSHVSLLCALQMLCRCMSCY